MIGWAEELGELVMENEHFSRVAVTGKYSQLTLMNIRPGEDQGKEIHLGLDEFVHIRAGKAVVTIGRSAEEILESHKLEQGWTLFIPAGYWYNIANRGEDDLKLYLISSPPAHRDGARYVTREDAQAGEADEERRAKLKRGYAEAEGFGA
jgi:mannose-6-phosphate isomerase-like protein (cupin superfamily)